MKKTANKIIAAAVLFVAAVVFLKVFNSVQNTRISFYMDLPERNYVVGKIEKGDIQIDDGGLFVLPPYLSYLSDSGAGRIVEYESDKYAVYFFTDKGEYGASEGYLFVLDAPSADVIGKASREYSFSDLCEISGNWMSCITY